MGKQRTPEGGGGIAGRKYYHCNVCNIDLLYSKDGTSPKTRHDETPTHKAIALGLNYDRCPRCELSVSKKTDGNSALSDHLKNR